MQMYEKAEIIPPDSVCTACGCQTGCFLEKGLSLWSLDNMLLQFCISYTNCKKSGRLILKVAFAQIHSVSLWESTL